jgi:hypothetical protein
MKGGARARSGPPPDPNALRRDAESDGEWTILPPEGRKGTTPKWPLDGQTKREGILWRSEWKRPQAVEWERQHQELEVALYVRAVANAERGGAPVNAFTLVKQLMEALGISQPGMLRNRWKVGHVDGPAETTAGASTLSARDRFRVVNGAGG